jgi:hypothetical protein
MNDFWHQWGDKIILVCLILFFSLLAMHGWYVKNGDQASFASDLAKQLVSAILTLLVAARTAWPKTNGNGGNGHDVSGKTGGISS